MSKVKVLLLLCMLFVSSNMLITAPPVRASEGYAKVYILSLTEVTCWNFGNQESHESKIQVKNGAIKALEFKEDSNLPMVHPNLGKNPPYYGISYYVITEWPTYKGIIESQSNIIVINTHGEILPIPTGYNAIGWVNKMAEAMLKRRVTWVHTGGYPFYRVWYQGATQSQEWPSGGTNGFKNFTAHINLNNVTCFPEGSETLKVIMNEAAEYTLIHGWYNITMAGKVELGRPLKGSDFKNYTILPIWGSEDTCMTGAVIAFVKPSEWKLPEECRGFGAYIHIGTRKTFTRDLGETDGDYYRGYVGAAAAVWTETLVFESFTSSRSYSDAWGESHWGLTATPAITWYSYVNGANRYKISIVFGVYGCLKTSGHKFIGDVIFYLGYLPDECVVMARSDLSKNGYKYGKPNIYVDSWQHVRLIIKPLLFFIGLGATGTLSAIVSGIGGVLLFSDYALLAASITDSVNGVDEIQPPSNYIDFTYIPKSFYEQPGDGFTYQEFQSLIYVELEVDMTNRECWSIIPMQWRITLRDNAHYAMLDLNGDCSIAIFKSFIKTGYKATVFFEDFSGEMSDWSVSDANSLAGLDYWGVVKTIPPGCVAWCAAVGNNSIYSEKPNIEKKLYDKQMNAYMARPVDLRPYRTPVTLRYHLFYRICAGDYLAVEYYNSGSWVLADVVTGNKEVDYWRQNPIPTTAEKIRFRFYSNEDDNVDWGVYINHIEIIAEMPNDANTNTDAGDNFDSATYVTYPNSYGAYLNNEEDWYKFDITQQNITDGKIVYISLQKPEYTIFHMELYDGNNSLKCNGVNTITYHMKTSDIPGQWRLKIHPIMGFGPYSFRIELLTPDGGGGCPILLVWNGSKYVDYGIINIHNPDGYDVIKEVSISTADMNIEGQVVKLRLKEGWEGLEYSHSLIDHVKLYAVDIFGNRYPCPLIKAMHSEQGNIMLQLLFSDNIKAEIYLMQTIDLQFIVLYPKEIIKSFIITIEGHNQEKIYY